MGDFQEALAALLGKDAPNLSPPVIARLRNEWEAEYERWQRRDLSARRYVYVWADGVYLQARMEPQAECMLVLIGATPEGKKELLGFQVGMRESAQSWRELLVDLKARGLTIAPELATGDGSLGFWKALEAVSPMTRHQRCTVHKTTNVLDKLPKSIQPVGKRLCLPVRQEIHDLVTLQVDQNGAVTMAAAPSPVIHRQHARRRCCSLAGGGGCHSQQRIRTNRHRKPCREPGARFTAKGERQMLLQASKPFRAAGVDQSHVLEALGKGLAVTGSVDAPEPPGCHSDRHRPTLPGQIAQFCAGTHYGCAATAAHKKGSPPNRRAAQPRWSPDQATAARAEPAARVE